MSTNSFLVLVGSAQGDPTKSGTHTYRHNYTYACSQLLFKFIGSIPQALLFNSSDLVKWTYVTTVWVGNSSIGPRAEYVDMIIIIEFMHM